MNETRALGILMDGQVHIEAWQLMVTRRALADYLQVRSSRSRYSSSFPHLCLRLRASTDTTDTRIKQMSLARRIPVGR